MTEFNDQSSPEYQAAYDAEMKRLETGEQSSAPATAETATTTAEPTTSDAEQQTETETEKPDRIAELEAKVLRQEKALKDTQRAFHERSRELAELRKAREAEQREATKPQILQEVPQLEEAFKYLNGTPPAQPSGQDLDALWLTQVQGAIPDIEQLLGDKDFEAAAMARRNELGPEAWRDPITAIRELNTLIRSQAVQKATAAAKADYEKRQKELSAMKVAGGSGRGAATSDRVNGKTAEQIWDMSPKDFAAEQRRVLGYSV